MAEEFFIPKLGQTVEEVTIIRWLVEDGAKVEAGQEILEVETDKAVFPVETFAGGYLHVGPYKEGDVVPVLTVVAVVGKKGDVFATKAGAKPPREHVGRESPEVAAAPVEAKAPAPEGEGRAFATPRARRLAREKGVDLSRVTPTGGGGVRVVEKDVLAHVEGMEHVERAPKLTPVARKVAVEAGLDIHGVRGSGGRITREDVELAVGRGAAQPPVPAAPLPEMEVLERVPLRGVRGIIAERMAASVHTTARVTLMMDVDATRFVEMRERLKARVEAEWGFAPGYNDLLAKIVAAALRKFPYMNARLAPDAVEYLAPVNLGMAVETERGLLVPVIRDADKKGLREFGAEFRELVQKVHSNRILPDDLSGGTFTITNLGMYEVDAFTPVINLPEAAILGVGRIAPRAVVVEGEVVARQTWTLCLVVDHRVVDGAPAARFLQHVKRLVEEPYLWLAV